MKWEQNEKCGLVSRASRESVSGHFLSDDVVPSVSEDPLILPPNEVRSMFSSSYGLYHKVRYVASDELRLEHWYHHTPVLKSLASLNC